MADVFISYAHEDRPLVLRVAAELERRGKDVWYDEQGIEPSDRWWDSVKEAIDAADTVVFVISEAWLASHIAGNELTYAVGAEKRLVPVKIADVADAAFPDALRELDWILLGPADDFDRGIEELVRALELDLELIRLHTRVLTRARAWELAGKRPSPLLRGEELRQAEEWRDRAATGVKPQPTPLQAEFIRESRRRAVRRQWIATGLTLAVAVLAIGLATLAFIERHQAVVQRNAAVSRELASQALTRIATDPPAAVRLAAQAVQTSATLEARAALLRALGADNLRFRVQTHVPLADQLAVDPTGRMLAVGGGATDTAGGLVRLVDLRSGRVIAADTRFTSNVNSLSFDRSGGKLVASSADKTVVIVDTHTGSALKRVSLADHPYTAQLSDDDARLVVQTDAQTVLSIDAASGRSVTLAHDATLGSLLAGGRVVAVTSRGIELFDVQSGRPLAPAFATGRSPIGAAALSPDGQEVVLQRNNQRVEVWDLRTGALAVMPSLWSPTVTPQLPPFTSPGGQPGMISPLVNAPPGGRVIALVQAGGGAITLHGTPDGGDRQLGVAFAPGADAFTSDGRLLALAAGSQLRVLDVLKGAGLESMPVAANRVLIGDGLLVSVDDSGEVDGWRLVPGGPLGGFFGHDGLVHDDVGPSGRLALAASSSAAWLVDPRSGQALGAPLVSENVSPSAGGDIVAVALSADGSAAAVVRQATGVQVFDTHTHALTASAPVRGAMTAQFSRNGSRLLVASSTRATVFDRSRQTIGPTVAVGGSGLEPVVASSPDGRRIASQVAVGVVEVWDASSGQPIGPAWKTGARLASLAFSADGSRVLGLADKAYIWRVGAASPVVRIDAGAKPQAAALSPDGTTVATTDQLPTGAYELRLSRAIDGRPLTGALVDAHDGAKLSFSSDGRYVAAGPVIWSVPDGLLVETLGGDYVDFDDVRFVSGPGYDLVAKSFLEPVVEGIALHTCELCLPLDQLLAIASRGIPAHL